jgi:hypothetical protein
VSFVSRVRDKEWATRAAALSGVYGGYEEPEDERWGEHEGISTTGVPFLDVSRWKLDDSGW